MTPISLFVAGVPQPRHQCGKIQELTRRGFDRDVIPVLPLIALFGPRRVSSELGNRRGFFVAAYGSANGRHNLFTSAEDEALIQGRANGLSWGAIGVQLGRRPSSLSNRMKVLRARQANPSQVEVDGIPHRKCGTCHEWVALADFIVGKSYCRSCRNQKHREWKVRNRERYLTHTRGYYQRHRDQIAMASREYKERTAERRAEIGRAWRAANPDRVRTYWQTRRARLLGSFVEEVAIEILIDRDRSICGVCEKTVVRAEASIDHVVPLFKGGEHSYANTQLAHLVCNKRKGVS